MATIPRRLAEYIKDDLQERGECRVITVPHDHPEAAHLIAECRSEGRKAGRELGWKIRTYAARGATHTVVWVLVEESTPEHQKLVAERGEESLRQALGVMSRRMGAMTPSPS